MTDKNYLTILFQQHIWKIFLLSLFLRLVSIFFIVDFDKLQLWEYGMIAQNIVHGNGYSLSYNPETSTPTSPTVGAINVPSAYMPPVYVSFLALFLYVCGDNHFTYLLILALQSVLGALSVIVLYWLTKRMFSEDIAVISGYVCAIYPPFLIAISDFGPTTIYLTFLGLLLLAMLQIKNTNSKALSLLGGLVAGILSLTRGEGIIIAFGLCVWMLFNAQLSRVLIFSFTLLLCVLPWVIRNYIVLEGFVPITTSSGLNFWRGNNSLSSGTSRDLSGEGIWVNAAIDSQIRALAFTPRFEIESSKIFLNDAISFIKNEPHKEIILVLKKIFYFWFLDITHPKARRFEYIVVWGTMLLFFIIGMVYIVKAHLNISVLLVFLVSMTVTTMMFFVLPRYQIILTYGMIPVSAVGMSGVYNSIFKKKIYN